MSRPGARRSPSVVRAQDDGEGGPPASQGPGGFSGSRLIVPGMEGFDSSYGDVNPNARSIPTPSQPGGRGGPPGDPRLADKPGSFPGGYDAPPKPGSEKREGEAFAPFRPPSEYLDAVDGDFLNEDDQMSFMRLRQRAGNWFQLAPLFPKLMRSGYLPDDIFDETGVEPREQSLWTTWTAARGSLVTDPRFPDEKLAYFDPEWNAETLSALQYLPSEKRAPFSEFVVDNEFNLEQTKELVKAVEIRAAHDSQAKGFGSNPGECLAFKMWRDVQEVQRYEGLGRVVELTEKGKKYATEQSTRERLDALVEMWRIDLAEGSEMEGGLMGKANAAGNAKIPAVRLDADELAFKPVPMLGPLEKLHGRGDPAQRLLQRFNAAGVSAPGGENPAGGLAAHGWRGQGGPFRPTPAIPRRPSTSSCASPPSSSPAAAAPRSSTCTAGRMSWRWSATGRAR